MAELVLGFGWNGTNFNNWNSSSLLSASVWSSLGIRWQQQQLPDQTCVKLHNKHLKLIRAIKLKFYLPEKTSAKSVMVAGKAGGDLALSLLIYHFCTSPALLPFTAPTPLISWDVISFVCVRCWSSRPMVTNDRRPFGMRTNDLSVANDRRPTTDGFLCWNISATVS